MRKWGVMNRCLATVALAVLLGHGGEAAEPPSTLLVNGVVVTLAGADNSTLADAVAISGNRIAAVGTDLEQIQFSPDHIRRRRSSFRIRLR